MRTIIKSNISIKEVDNMANRVDSFFYSFTRLISVFIISFLLFVLALVLNLPTDLLVSVCFVTALSCIFALMHCAFVVIKAMSHIRNDIYKRFDKDVLKDCILIKNNSNNCLEIRLSNGDIIIYEFDD